MTSRQKPFRILGIGAATCAACCAGPLLGFIAATGILTAGGLALYGTIGLLIAIPGIVVIVGRRTRPSTCSPRSEPVPVTGPSRLR